MMRPFKNMFRRFRRDEEGSVVVEAAIMFPTLFAACLATYVFFDAFRNQSVNLKAAYTISDALSRETEYITNTYITSLWRMHAFLTTSSEDTKLRISVITYDDEEEEYSVVWSQQRGNAGVLNQGKLDDLVDNEQVPVMPDGEVVIVVQTWVTHEPVFTVGASGDAFALEFEDLVITRPRFAPQLCYSPNGTRSGAVCS